MICATFLTVGCGQMTMPNDGGSDAATDAEPDGGPQLSGVSAGNQYTCAVSRGRSVCWGLNLFGPIDGIGTIAVQSHPVVVSGAPETAVVAASALGSYPQTCAITTQSQLYCWGSNFDGQIGNGTTDSAAATAPTLIAPNTNVVGCGNNYTCAVASNGAASCWGSAGSGQLGLGAGDGGPPPDRYSPTQLAAISGTTAIATDDRTTCAIAGGNVWCWGANDQGQIGDGTTTTRYSPVKLSSLSNATSLALGGLHACAIASGQVYCWGSNDRGQLGDGKAQPKSLVPIPVQSLTDAVAVTAGYVHTCALTKAGAVYCWGGNDWGNVGDGTVMTERDTPVLVSGLPPATAISAGAEHTCALLASGQAMCWGDDTYGELGDGVADGGPRSVPTPVGVVGIP